MARNGNSSRKRAPESETPMESEDDEEEDEDTIGSDDEEMEGAEEDRNAVIGSPSPEKRKDMVLRSGRRKRRRSKETTGLTPPEEPKAFKKARLTIERKSKTSENGEDMVVERTKPPLPTSTKLTLQTTDTSIPNVPKANRESLSGMDPSALVTAQDPEMYETEAMLEPPDGESSRRLFQNQAVARYAEEPTIVKQLVPVHAEPVIPEPTTHLNGNHGITKEPTISLTSRGIFWRIAFMLVFGFPFYIFVHPMCVKLADIVMPLRELELPEPTVNESLVEDPPLPFQQTIETLSRTHGRATHKMETLQKSRHLLEESTQKLELLIQEKKAAIQRENLLKQAEKSLLAALQESDTLDSVLWQQARATLKALGQTILDTPAIELWRVDVPERCDESLERMATTATTNDDDANPPLLASQIDSQLIEWTKQTKQSTTDLKKSPETKKLVRHWIKVQIEKTLEGDQKISNRIEALLGTSKEDAADGAAPGLTMAEIDEIIHERLDIELADRTGEYDHAAIHNGARIIRTGKRATSKSLIDTLPLGNRLLQFSQLQFYGFGPEAAITPTYPPNALGQCWSFEQTPIRDLLKRRHDRGGGDDHKSGNFGTLTIRLPTPVAVSSVVIEHPPKGITDQRNTAIRDFRVIGYQDAEAMTKSWSLGSFIYDIGTFAYTHSYSCFEFTTSAFSSQTIFLFQNLSIQCKNLM